MQSLHAAIPVSYTHLFVAKSVQTDCLMEVAAGTADAAVLDLTLASAMIGEGTDYANLVIKDELNVEEYGEMCIRDRF